MYMYVILIINYHVQLITNTCKIYGMVDMVVYWYSYLVVGGLSLMMLLTTLQTLELKLNATVPRNKGKQ